MCLLQVPQVLLSRILVGVDGILGPFLEAKNINGMK